MAVPLADASAMIIVADTTGALQAARYTGGTLQAWKNIGSGFTGLPSAVILPGYQMRVFAHNTSGQVMTTLSDAAGTFNAAYVVRTAAQTLRLYTVQEPLSLTALATQRPSASAAQP